MSQKDLASLFAQAAKTTDSIKERQALRDQLARDCKAYLSAGGEITELPPGLMAQNPMDPRRTPKNRFIPPKGRAA